MSAGERRDAVAPVDPAADRQQVLASRQFQWLDAAGLVAPPALPVDPTLAAWLVENITARIAVVSLDQRYLYANRELLDFLGLPAERVIGRPVAEVVGEAVVASYAPLRQRIHGGEALRWEGWVDYGARGRRWLQETLVPYAPDGRTVQGVVVYGRDHTALKLREVELAAKLAELEASETLKAAIVDHALAAIVTTDAQGRIVEFNPAAEAMFGRRRDDVLGACVSETLMPERFRAAHLAGMARLEAGDAPRLLGKRLELHALRADGGEFPIEMVLWRTRVGESAFYCASLVDVTERRAAAEQIEKQREALRQGEKLAAMGGLLAGVAHELNNPLAIVMGRAGLLEEKLAEAGAASDVRDDLRRVREAAERCGRIVRTFLDVARARPMRRAPVALNDLVAAAVDLLQVGLRGHGIALDLVLAGDLPAVSADADQLGQVVMNLLVNAQQVLAAAPGRRRIVVRTGTRRGAADEPLQAWLRVADSGPGVEAALRARIFEPFFTTKPDGMGTGLGLAMARLVARQHGGELVLEDGGELGGASFRLGLPAADEARRDGALPPPPAAQPAAARVLVVDDEAEIAAMMREMLEGAGYEVAVAESGAVALELLATARFDAVVSDLRMPEMDGAAFWREATARHPALARRFVFVTGDTLAPDARHFLARTGSASLDKPFGKADLIERVRGLLR